MFKSIVNWWKGQFGDGSVTYQEDESVEYKPEPPTEPIEQWVYLPEGKKVNISNNLIMSNWLKHCEDRTELLDKDTLDFRYTCLKLNIDLDNWTSPMMELFQLWRRDFSNFEVVESVENYVNRAQITHKILGISITIETRDHYTHMKYVSLRHNTGLTNEELCDVITACELYKSTKEYQRYLRIKSLSDFRALELSKKLDEQEKLNYRNAQTNRIRDYLESK